MFTAVIPNVYSVLARSPTIVTVVLHPADTLYTAPGVVPAVTAGVDAGRVATSVVDTRPYAASGSAFPVAFASMALPGTQNAGTVPTMMLTLYSVMAAPPVASDDRASQTRVTLDDVTPPTHASGVTARPKGVDVRPQPLKERGAPGAKGAVAALVRWGRDQLDQALTAPAGGVKLSRGSDACDPFTAVTNAATAAAAEGASAVNAATRARYHASALRDHVVYCMDVALDGARTTALVVVPGAPTAPNVT